MAPHIKLRGIHYCIKETVKHSRHLFRIITEPGRCGNKWRSYLVFNSYPAVIAFVVQSYLLQVVRPWLSFLQRCLERRIHKRLRESLCGLRRIAASWNLRRFVLHRVVFWQMLFTCELLEGKFCRKAPWTPGLLENLQEVTDQGHCGEVLDVNIFFKCPCTMVSPQSAQLSTTLLTPTG